MKPAESTSETTKSTFDYHKRIHGFSKSILTASVTFLTIIIAVLGLIKDQTLLAEIKYPLYGVVISGFLAFVGSIKTLMKQVEKKNMDKIDYGKHWLNIQAYALVVMVFIICGIIFILTTKLQTLPKI